MSLNKIKQEWWHLLVNDHQHEESGEAKHSRDARVPTRKSKTGAGGELPRDDLPVSGRTAGESPVSEAEEERTRERRFGAKITGLSRAQMTRLIGRWIEHRHIEKSRFHYRSDAPAHAYKGVHPIQNVSRPKR